MSSFPTALATFVPEVLARLQQRHPQVALTVVDDHLHRLLPRLEDFELDLAMGTTRAPRCRRATDGSGTTCSTIRTR